MTPVVQAVTNVLSLGTVLADVLAIVLFVIILGSLQQKGWGKKLADFFGNEAILFSFLIAAGGVIGSLFYSDFAHFPPCELCWIQRAFLYTQAVILFVAMLARKAERRKLYDKIVEKCCLVLSCCGFAVAAYHTYLQLGGGAIVPCSAVGPSCQYVYFIQYGYVTIPTMSLTAFALILLFMLLKKSEE
jgi:disulfide bond formation protein DsbB